MAGLLLPFAAYACYPTSFENRSQTDVVGTIEMPDVDYQANRTFVVTSTVYDLGDALGLECAQEIDERFDPLIIDTIRERMEEFGYEEELSPDTNPPDVGVFVGAVVCEGWVAYWWPGWAGWWGPFPPVWSPVPVVSTFRTGTLAFPMVRLGETLGDRDPDAAVEVIWYAAADGLLSSNRNANADRVRRAINQAFEQSPYLRVGGANP